MVVVEIIYYSINVAAILNDMVLDDELCCKILWPSHK